MWFNKYLEYIGLFSLLIFVMLYSYLEEVR